jgi:phosphatidate cytidylyltransferase
MLGTRLFFGLSMIAGLLLALFIDEWLAPWYPLWFLISGCALVVAAGEMIGLLDATTVFPSRNSVIGGVVTLLVANWLPHVTVARDEREHLSALSYDPAAALAPFAYLFLAFAAVIMMCFVAQGLQFQKPGRTVARIAGTLFVIAYVAILGSFIIQMRWFPGKFQGIVALVFMISTAKGSDTGAYTFGRLMGRRKLWPALSPHKTVEGAFGGLLFGVGFALLAAAIARFGLGIPTLGWGEAAFFGVLVGAVAQVGDLMESMIKRDCERKDASAAVPGFGGLLDVLDSLLFAGPVAYGIWLWLGP